MVSRRELRDGKRSHYRCFGKRICEILSRPGKAQKKEIHRRCSGTEHDVAEREERKSVEEGGDDGRAEEGGV